MKEQFDPDIEINFGFMYMTAFEFAVVTCDWKMALLFFINGADPYVKCCDGSMRLTHKQIGDDMNELNNEIHLNPTFQSDRISHLVGFERFRALLPDEHVVNEHSNLILMQECLWLMEIAHGDTILCAHCNTSRIWNIITYISSNLGKTTDLLQELATITATCLTIIDSLSDPFFHVNDGMLNSINHNFSHDDILLDNVLFFLRNIINFF